MTIETLNAIKADASSLRTGLLDLGDKVSLAEAEGLVIPAEIDAALDATLLNLDTILTWVNQAITDGTVEEPQLESMAMFLSEIKAVFEKYSAVLNVINGEGYGAESYGTNYGGADVIQFTVTDPVSGQVTTKEFIQTSLSAVDLV